MMFDGMMDDTCIHGRELGRLCVECGGVAQRTPIGPTIYSALPIREVPAQPATFMEALVVATERMLAVIRKHEWVLMGVTKPQCLDCDRYQDQGHAPGCEIARALGRPTVEQA